MVRAKIRTRTPRRRGIDKDKKRRHVAMTDERLAKRLDAVVDVQAGPNGRVLQAGRCGEVVGVS